MTYHPDAEFPRRVAAIADQVEAMVVVDNGSDAAALTMLRALAASRPALELIENGVNRGVASALNAGVTRAEMRGVDWVLLFDQDSEALEGLVDGLFEVVGAFPPDRRLGIVGAGYEAPAGVAPAPADTAAFAPAAVNGAGGAPPWIEVENVITSGSLIPLSAWRAIGAFRDELFIDYVDIEYCRRARAQGYALVDTRRSLMRHAIGSPSRHRLLGADKWTTNHSADRRYYIARNDTVMLRESGRYPHGRWVLKSLGRRLRTCRRVWMFERNKGAKIAATLQGLWHGMRGRLGPR